MSESASAPYRQFLVMAKSTPTPAPTRSHPREENVLRIHPSWKGMFGWYAKWLLMALVVVAIAFALMHANVIPAYLFVLVIVGAFGIVLLIGWLTRLATSYLVTNRRVSETTGILNKRTESAYFTEITNTTIERNLSERLLGIGRLDFDTAGERMVAHELNRRNRATNTAFLSWWGVPDVQRVAELIDGLRFGDDDSENADAS